MTAEQKENLEFFFKYTFPVKIETFYTYTYKKGIQIELKNIKMLSDSCFCEYAANNKSFFVSFYKHYSDCLFDISKTENSAAKHLRIQDIGINELLDNSILLDNFLDTTLDSEFGKWFNASILQEEIADIKLKHFTPDNVFRLYKQPGSSSVRSLGIIYKNYEFQLDFTNDKFKILYFENQEDIKDILQSQKQITLSSYGSQSYKDQNYIYYQIKKGRVGKKEFAQLTLYGYKVYVDVNTLSNYIYENPDLIKKYKIVTEK